MGNLIDYVKQNENVTFGERKLGIEDLAVFAQFAYLKFDALVPSLAEDKKGVSIRALASHPGRDSLFEMEWLSKDNEKLFWAMADSDRFAKVKLRNYARVADNKYRVSFAAVMFELPDGECVASFRGTDELLAGWIEDLQLGFDKVIPGQEFAAAYLRRLFHEGENVVYVTGHSKGGNLAEYGASQLTAEQLAHIRRICNFDGPGQRYRNPDLERIKTKYLKIVPIQSVVGMLYEKPENVRLAASRGRGLCQHNLYFWIFRNGKLVQVRKTEKIRKRFKRKKKNMSERERLWLGRFLGFAVRHVSADGNDNLWAYLHYRYRNHRKWEKWIALKKGG